MIIKKIELQGFKSFPERTKILFHPGITAIVGPNGTGKSNIVDALLWVLGGQRSKSLKGERTEDIIFNGNTRRPPMGMAEVVLTLAEDEEELLIGHRVFRSGESEYRLNGKQCRLKDIQDALWNRAIAEKEYFVIEQGQIGLFLTSKPTEKRQLLEEAAGTAFYKAKKKEAQSKLETSEQNLIRVEDIVAEVSRAKNSLKRQAAAAIQYRKLREKIRQLKSLHYRKKIIDLEKSLREITRSYEECSGREKETIALLKAEEKSLAGKRKGVWDLEKSIQDGQKGLFALKSELSRLEAEREKASERIDRLEEQKRRAVKNIEELRQELLQIEKEEKDIEGELKSAEEDRSRLIHSLTAAEKENQVSQQQLELRAGELDALRNEYLKRLSEHTEIKNERFRIEKEIELIRRQQEKLSAQLETALANLKEKERALEEREKARLDTQRLISERQKTLSDHQKELEGMSESLENLQREISLLSRAREEKIHHLQALEKLREKEKSPDGPQDIPGSLGILADLVETSPEHAPLIDIFWKEEAKATLVPAREFLRILAEKELKGNFLLLSRQTTCEIPAEVSRDPRVAGLFKSFLRPGPQLKDHLAQFEEAVIVRDVRSAVELWLLFPALNFITLQGDVLFSSGLLRMKEKKEGLFTLGQEIKKIGDAITGLEKKTAPLALERNEKEAKKDRLEKEIEKERAELVRLERKIEEMEKDKKYERTEKQKIETTKALLEREIKVFDEEKDALEARLGALGLEKIEEEENALKKRLEAEEKAAAAGQEKAEEKRSGYFELKSSLDLSEEKIKNLRHRQQRLKERARALAAKVTASGDEIRVWTEEQSTLRENRETLKKKTEGLEKERARKEQELVRSESLLQKMQKEQDELEKKIEKLRVESEARKEERVKREISRAETDRDLVNLEESCWQDLKKTIHEVKEEIPDEKIPEEEVAGKLSEAEERLQKFKSVNLMAEEEYEIQKKRYDFLMQQKKDLRESIDTTREAIRKIDQESESQFMKALQEVNRNFQEVFSLLFNGGTAELTLSDPDDPLESGVDITAQPPGKKVQTLSLLSGGEKSLTSLAFFFALFRSKPTPFCVLDEVDAALDEVNLKRFLELMRKIKNQTQFILITHNFKTMEVADYIHGTTMAEPNITSLYSIKLEKKEENAL